MTRRDVLLEKWAEYWMDGDDDEGPVTEPPNYYFEAGFNAAWDALMLEIRPLVASLHSLCIPANGDKYEHDAAILRLRELCDE